MYIFIEKILKLYLLHLYSYSLFHVHKYITVTFSFHVIFSLNLTFLVFRTAITGAKFNK